jgi:antitoxin (DNA-binding transcriptional repressor) of toxin-antitoxin stability system
MRRTRISATELRVHLGETLRRLSNEELVIEKGGVPVAVLRRYEAVAAESAVEAEYERALARRAEPRGWERMDAAMAAGWAGVEAEEIVANVYRWRDEDARAARHFVFRDDDVEEIDDDPGVSPGQRRLRPEHPPTRLIADGNGEKYQA